MSGPSGRTVGFVGLGHMGTPMVSRLVDAGVTVRAYDASPEALAEYQTAKRAHKAALRAASATG